MIRCENLSCDSDQDENSTFFLWVVKDVIKFPIQRCDKYVSTFCDIKICNSFESTCRIFLFPTCSGIGLELRLEKCTQNVFASLSVGVLDHEFNKQFKVTKSYFSVSSSVSVSIENILTQECLIKHKETLLHNEDLILIGKLTIFNDGKHYYFPPISSYSQFSQTLRTLWKDCIFSDFSIVVQDKKFPCHKVALAARSAYFEALFNSCMKENETQELSVTDSEADVMEQVLSYIYTNTLNITPSNVVPILYAAEKYLLHDLKLICENKMHRYFSFRNCGELYKIANKYDLPTIKVRALHTRMLFTKQFETKKGGPDSNDIEVSEAANVDCETSHENAHLGVNPDNVNYDVNSNGKPDSYIDKQESFIIEPFLPYADVWNVNNRRALFEHNWWIKNFKELKHSGTFITHTFTDNFYNAAYKMTISACYNSNERGKNEYCVKLNFSVLSSQNEDTWIEFRSSIIPVLGDLIKLPHPNDFNVKGYLNNLKIEEIATVYSVNISQTSVDSLLHTGDLLINCKCWVPSSDYYYHKPPDLKDNLIADFSGIYTSRKFSDLIINVGSSVFQCHKAVISCRSRFFARMLKEQKNELTITLDDIDEKTFEKILRYIYTDQCDSVEADARELLPFASKYELEHLKTMSEKHLISSLSLKNAVEALQLSISHSASTLQKHALRYIEENFSRIFSGPDIMDKIKKRDISKIFDNVQ